MNKATNRVDLATEEKNIFGLILFLSVYSHNSIPLQEKEVAEICFLMLHSPFIHFLLLFLQSLLTI